CFQLKPIRSLKRILNESPECGLVVISQRKCGHLLFFKIVRPNINACYPFRFFFAVGIACFGKSGCLCSLKLVIGNSCIAVKITYAVLYLYKTVFVYRMVKNKLGRIALCFVFFKILVCVIAFAFDVKRSEEHTSELQSRENLVCRLLLEKKNSRK